MSSSLILDTCFLRKAGKIFKIFPAFFILNAENNDGDLKLAHRTRTGTGILILYGDEKGDTTGTAEAI